MVSKILAFFLKKQLMERDYEVELAIIEKHINNELPLYETARVKDMLDADDRKKKFT